VRVGAGKPRPYAGFTSHPVRVSSHGHGPLLICVWEEAHFSYHEFTLISKCFYALRLCVSAVIFSETHLKRIRCERQHKQGKRNPADHFAGGVQGAVIIHRGRMFSANNKEQQHTPQQPALPGYNP